MTENGARALLFLVAGAIVTAVLLLTLSVTILLRRGKTSVASLTNDVPERLEVQLVVARYMEDLRFLIEDKRFAPYLSTAIIYNTGENNIDAAVCKRVKAVVSMRNVGRCDHTYLHHIIQGLQTKSLADRTIFITGSCTSLSHKMQYLQAILDGRVPAVQHIYHMFEDFALTHWKATDGQNALKNPESELLPAPVRPFGRWLEAVFGKDLARNMVAPVFYGGVFFAAAGNLAQTPLHVYKTLLKQLETHSNPEAGHYVERVWGFLASSGALPPSASPPAQNLS